MDYLYKKIGGCLVLFLRSDLEEVKKIVFYSVI